MQREAIDNEILEGMPYFIAVNYQRLLEADIPRSQVEIALHTYNLGLRALTIGLVSQYLIRDRDQISDSYLNNLLLQKFPHLTLDAWQQLLFATLRAYEGSRDRFFMPELYDFYWDTSFLPHRQRSEVEVPFARLTQIAVEIQTGRIIPQDELAWATLADEVVRLLRQVLASVAFLGQYDLIRVLDYNPQFYEFELHKGLTINKGREPLIKNEELGRGWFYLRKETKGLLPLYPFLVFWENHAAQTQLGSPEVGIYDKIIYERLQYLLAKLGQTMLNDASVSAFITWLYDTIEEAKRQRQIAEKLNWWQLRDICMDITRLRMATVEKKYRHELYLQRNKTRQAFERFLDSDKRCFVLIGKSGVGKSNFFLALREELQQSRSNICVLMYDGANLKVEPSVTDVISEDFDNRLVLEGRQIQQVWREIAKIEGIEERLMLLVVDAINEHPQAKELLRQLDELVQSPWPWLKIIFSSRPETWQTIKRGVRLADGLYFQENDSNLLGVELEPFSYSEKLEPFSGEELPDAYAKYQVSFKLQTVYYDVPDELRSVLQDPLSLWLVASTYAGKSIPRNLKVTELIGKYVDALLQSGRLYYDDCRLLETRLVPLMVQHGYYKNMLTIADIDAAGKGLYESIYSEQVLSDGRRVNQSFINLVDTDILAHQTEGRNQSIAFKYERFYEYFVGRRLIELAAETVEREQFYRGIATRIPAAPFLWGPLRTALKLEIIEGHTELLQNLAKTTDQNLREVITAALVEYGADNLSTVKDILIAILDKDEEKNSFIKSFNRLILRRTTELATEVKTAKHLAIEAAFQLNLADVLERAALDLSSSVRASAVQHIYYLWKKNPSLGMTVLEKLSATVERNVKFSSLTLLESGIAALESCLGISLSILFDGYRQPGVQDKLRQIWRTIIEHLLFINANRSSQSKFSLAGQLRERIVSLGIDFILKVVTNAEGEGTALGVAEMEHFFKQDNERRQLLSRLVSYINPAFGRLIDIKTDLLKAIQEYDYLTVVTFWLIMLSHGKHNFSQTQPILDELFHKSLEIDKSNSYAQYTLMALVTLTQVGQQLDDVILQKITHYMELLYEANGFRFKTAHGFVRLPSLDEHLVLHRQRFGNSDSDFAKNLLQKVKATKNVSLMVDLINGTYGSLRVLAISRSEPRLALEVLAQILDYQDKYIEQAMVDLLADMRVYYTDNVDDFLASHNVSKDIVDRVKHKATTERMETLIQVKGYFFLINIMLETPSIRDEFVIDLLQKATTANDLNSWLKIGVKRLFNLIYGDKIFQL